MYFFVVNSIDAQTLLGLATGGELEPLLIQEENDVAMAEPEASTHVVGQLPHHEIVGFNGDNLNNVILTF